MRKIIKILFLIFISFTLFSTSYGNVDEDRGSDRDEISSSTSRIGSSDCKAVIQNTSSVTLDMSHTFGYNCDSVSRSPYRNWTYFSSIPRIEGGNGLDCENNAGTSRCSATCGDIPPAGSNTGEDGDLYKIVRPTFITVGRNQLFGHFHYPHLLNKTDFRQPVNLELVASLENIININESENLFRGFFDKKYKYYNTCHVSCFNPPPIRIIEGTNPDGSPKYKFIPVAQTHSVTSCTTPTLNPPITETPLIKVGVVPPVIEVKVVDENCVQDGTGYSCYASEGLKFELTVKSQGNPSPVNNLKSYVLNFQRNGCADGGVAGTCSEFVIGTTGGEFMLHSTDFRKAGDYSVEFSGLNMDGSGTVKNISRAFYVDIKIVPNPDGLVGESVAESGGDAFANFEDFYKYDITIKDKYGNPIKSKKIVDLACTSDCIPDLSGNKGIHISDFDKNPNGEGGENIFRIVSAVPSTKGAKPIFDGKLKKWDQKYNDIEDEETGFKIETKSTKTFKEPISYVGIEVEGGNLDVSKSQKYRIGLKNEGGLKDYRNGRVFNFNPGNIVLTDSSSYEFEGNSFKEVNENFGSDINNGFGDVNTILSGTKLTFKAVIKALKDVAILEKARIEVRDLSISYNLLKNGKSYSIGYKLSTSGVLEGCKRVTTGLMVNGISQGSGKLNYTSEVNTFANSSKLDFKQAVRKNVANLTRNLTSGTKINSIYFVDLSKSANKDLKFSTIKSKLAKNDNLILKGGNLVIDTDVNDSIGIVVSADNFDVESNREIGNIYVTKNIKKINAFIYADGGFISGQGTGKARYTDEELRENKLDLQGSLFTSNTIGGSEKGENYCRLPGDRKTTDCELAKLYDLNYIRMHILCEKEDYSFKIEYNPSIQLNPPKVFIIR
ncbi:hypothetical protein DLH72_04405 [Candidatus Gracilibacteria bacterium]|nr:MAG: hypothetical protein DLH72_04405 [Candidatus Gracilibacteria bacterium]